jgi:N-acetylglucosaminyldiphosphoundecaprenol N-acetyl-beta-D-mannosaminyltransferase
MNKKVNFLNIPIDAITMRETLNRVEQVIASNQQIHHTVVNAGKVVLMQTDAVLEKSVVEADIINADGQGVVWGANILGKNIPERVSGIDLMESLVRIASKESYKCFFFGAREEVVKKVVDIYKHKYSEDIIAGYRNGYFEQEDEEEIANQIAESGADMLFVAIRSPKKEVFLSTYKNKLKSVNLIMGVGGSFDVISGKIARAPLWMQKIGMEWFFRFINEPIRTWRRYLLGNPKFIWLVFKAYLKNK